MLNGNRLDLFSLRFLLNPAVLPRLTRNSYLKNRQLVIRVNNKPSCALSREARHLQDVFTSNDLDYRVELIVWYGLLADMADNGIFEKIGPGQYSLVGSQQSLSGVSQR